MGYKCKFCGKLKDLYDGLDVCTACLKRANQDVLRNNIIKNQRKGGKKK